LAGIFHAEFQRRETCLVANLVGHNLVHRNSNLDIDCRFAWLNPSKVRTTAAAMIARAVEQRASVVVGQVAKHEDVLLVALERLHDARQLV
jgi:hypothetical protein